MPDTINFEATVAEIKTLIDQKMTGAITAEQFEAKQLEITKSFNERIDLLETKMNRPGASKDGNALETKREEFGDYLKKSISEGTDAAGGYILDRELYAGVITNVIEVSPVRRYATVYPSAQPSIEFPTTTGTFTVTGVASTGSRSATDTPATFTLKTIKAWEAFANALVTETMIEDTVWGLSAWVEGQIADQFASWEGAQFIGGDGTTEPEGLLTATGTNACTASASATLVYTDITKLVFSLKQAYRGNAVFLAHRTTIQALAELRDNNGRPLWVDSVAQGVAPTLMGYPVVEANDMPEIGTGNKVLIFADLKRGYFILDKPQINTLYDPFSNKPYLGFYCRHRIGGGVLLPEAISVLSMK